MCVGGGGVGARGRGRAGGGRQRQRQRQRGAGAQEGACFGFQQSTAPVARMEIGLPTRLRPPAPRLACRMKKTMQRLAKSPYSCFEARDSCSGRCQGRAGRLGPGMAAHATRVAAKSGERWAGRQTGSLARLCGQRQP